MRFRDDIWWRVYSATVAARAAARQWHDIEGWALIDHRHAVDVADANDDVRLAAKQYEREDGTIERVSGK